MNILYIHQYYKTPNESGGNRSYWIVNKLIEENNVTVITGEEIKSPGDKINLKVISVKIIYKNSFGKLRRIVAFMRYIFFVIRYIIYNRKNIDLIIATSTPITVFIPAIFGKFFFQIPFILEIRDVWPEFLIQIGTLKSKFLRVLLEKLELIGYKYSTYIITLSPGMEKLIRKTCLKKNINKDIYVIPNFSKNILFGNSKKLREARWNLNKNINKRYKIIYFGSLGFANNIEFILDLAKYFKQESIPIDLLVIGEGFMLKNAIDFIEKYKLDNINLIPPVSMLKLENYLIESDLSLVTFKNLPILGTNSPNKLFDSLSSGLPVVVTNDGWTKDLVEENNCGIYVNPESIEASANKIFNLIKDPELLNAMSNNCVNLSNTKFDVSIQVENYQSIFKKYFS